MINRNFSIKIKTEVNDSNLGDFKTSTGWLEHFKKRFCLRQTRIVGEAGYVLITTITAWMERLPEIMQGFSADDIWNMDESGLFFKARPDTGLPKKLKSVKAVRNQKSHLLLHFLCPRIKFPDAFENCLILLNRTVCSIFTTKKHE